MVDPDKIQAILSDTTLGETHDLSRALEMVALLEAQLKDMNPNLDSISEYAWAPINFNILFDIYGLPFNLIVPFEVTILVFY